jgi:hypothetical protein
MLAVGDWKGHTRMYVHATPRSPRARARPRVRTSEAFGAIVGSGIKLQTRSEPR